MKRYKTTGTVSLFTGLIGLSDRQARPRVQAGQIKQAGEDIYEIMAPVQFKVGELITLDAPKGVAHLLDCLDEDEPEAKADEQAAPAAQADEQAAPAAPAAPVGPGRPRISRGGRR